MIYELGDRVLSALYQENSGNIYHRHGVIIDRWLDGLIHRVDFYEEQYKKEGWK